MNKSRVLSSKMGVEKSQKLGIYENPNSGKLPILFIFVGLVASGKSTYAETLFVRHDGKTVSKPVIHSSDALREELYGDANEQGDNNKLFSILHKRIKDDLRNGNDVIYDATNISKKRRTAFLNEVSRIPCYKVCVAVMAPYETCITQNQNRDRIVPDEVIRKMYLNWNPPAYDEGFDDIVLLYNYESNESRESFTLDNFFSVADSIDQENRHHTYTIGGHCRAAGAYLKEHYPGDTLLHTAGLMHDIGKVFTKSRTNIKGIDDGECHYYQHHCVGSYDSMFYTEMLGLSVPDRLDIANLIYYHMMPLTAWKQSEKAKEKAKRQIGENFYNRVMMLHEADNAAH